MVTVWLGAKENQVLGTAVMKTRQKNIFWPEKTNLAAKWFFGTPSMSKNFFSAKKTSLWSLLAVATDILVSRNISVVPVSLISEEISRKTWESIEAHTLYVHFGVIS